MPLSEFELKRCEKLMAVFLERKRPAASIRKELDIGFRIRNQSIEIFEIRPVWDNPSDVMEHPVAKTTCVKSRACWKIYWMKADLKWHGYEPMPEVALLEEFLDAVERDPFGCFWG